MSSALHMLRIISEMPLVVTMAHFEALQNEVQAEWSQIVIKSDLLGLGKWTSD